MECFVPIKANSQRVIEKNFLPIPGLGMSLTQLKLSQLATCPSISRIIISTDDQDKLETHLSPNFRHLCEIIQRPDRLATPHARISDLAIHASEICSAEYVLWTHVTSPGLCGADYHAAIQNFSKGRSKGYDSAISVSRLQNFLLDRNLRPSNFESPNGDWPATQSLEVQWEVTSGIFIADRKLLATGHRVGKVPMPIYLNRIQATDIDYPEDFEGLSQLRLVANG